jgi:hypothetical protein
MVPSNIAGFIFIVVLLTAVYRTWHLEICLFWKDHFGKLENGNPNKHMLRCKILCIVPVHRIHEVKSCMGFVSVYAYYIITVTNSTLIQYDTDIKI